MGNGNCKKNKKNTRRLFYLQGSRLVERSGLRSICHWNDKLANVRIWSAVELKLAGEVEERVGDDWKEKSFFISCHNVKSV
jgi:hypothetical protein